MKERRPDPATENLLESILRVARHLLYSASDEDKAAIAKALKEMLPKEQTPPPPVQKLPEDWTPSSKKKKKKK